MRVASMFLEGCDLLRERATPYYRHRPFTFQRPAGLPQWVTVPEWCSAFAVPKNLVYGELNRIGLGPADLRAGSASRTRGNARLVSQGPVAVTAEYSARFVYKLMEDLEARERVRPARPHLSASERMGVVAQARSFGVRRSTLAAALSVGETSVLQIEGRAERFLANPAIRRLLHRRIKAKIEAMPRDAVDSRADRLIVGTAPNEVT